MSKKQVLVVKPLARLRFDEFCRNHHLTINVVEIASMPGDSSRYHAFLTYGEAQVFVLPTTKCERSGAVIPIRENSYGHDVTSAVTALLRIVNGRSLSIESLDSSKRTTGYQQVAPVAYFYPIGVIHKQKDTYVIESGSNV